jgi:hypothetical protein
VLYAAAMFAMALPSRWRERRFWISVVVFGAGIAAFSAVCFREWGMLWPSNHSGTISLSNFARTLDVVQRSRLFSFYAQALSVSEPVLAALTCLLVLGVLLSSLQMLRKDIHLIWMPATALGNVAMVFLVGPIPAEAAKFHDFFRHISYGFPLLGITLAYGLSQVIQRMRGRRALMCQALAGTALLAVVLAELLLLEGPVRPVDTIRGPLTTTDVHVTAAQLVTDPFPLPRMEFRQEGFRYLPSSEEYMGIYPDDVYNHFAPSDVRRSDNSLDYYTAAAVLFLGLVVLAFAPSPILAITRRPATQSAFDCGSRGSSL